MEGILNGGHDVQVSAKIPRRRFTAAYKLKIVREADACAQPGELAPPPASPRAPPRTSGCGSVRPAGTSSGSIG